MVVNYYGILGCECIWDQNGVFLSAPAGVQVQSLQQLGFYTAADGRWYKQLSPQESAFLNSMKHFLSVWSTPIFSILYHLCQINKQVMSIKYKKTN